MKEDITRDCQQYSDSTLWCVCVCLGVGGRAGGGGGGGYTSGRTEDSTDNLRVNSLRDVCTFKIKAYAATRIEW